MMMHNTSNFYAGLSGIQLPVPKYKYPLEYQAGSRLTYYATHFNSIEINSSFYKIPGKNTVARWSSSVPENFRFTFKLFREITHAKNLDFDPGQVQKFIETIGHVSEKKGCVLVQFPPSLKTESIDQFNHLLHSIRIADPDSHWPIAVEFRNPAWYNDDVYDILTSYNASLVLHDKPVSATPLRQETSDTLYVRFHGPTGNYKGSYSDDFLTEYAALILEWLEEDKTVYVYFNNTNGDAFNNLVTLKRFLDQRR
ncbi:MAG TPA: DUF72 domain-containing protein [Ohtaekwangia sp.]|nr:DUF72 domain-containing protein [Ohtaekwangia sp.]